MTTVTLELEEDVLSATRCSPKEFTQEMKLAAAMAWYREGRLSQEIAANMCGLDRTDFLLELAKHGVDSFHVDFNELDEELNRG
jgi:predicted HTH domain antitoxin